MNRMAPIASLCGLCVVGCAPDGPVVIFKLLNVPELAEIAQIEVNFGDRPNSNPVPDLDLRGVPRQGPITFGLRAPEGYSGILSVQAGLLGPGPAGEPRCLLATAHGAADLSAGGGKEQELPVAQLATPICGIDGVPRSITAIDPPYVASSGGMVKIQGWGFSPQSQVLFGNQSAERQAYLSAGELQAQVPPCLACTDPIDVIVRKEGTPEIRAPRLLRYRLATVTFSPLDPVSGGRGPQALATINLSGDDRPEVIVADRFGDKLEFLAADMSGKLSNQNMPIGFGMIKGPIDLANQGDLLAVALYDSDELAVLRRNQASYRIDRSLVSMYKLPDSVAMGALTGDGLPGIAIGGMGGVQILCKGVAAPGEMTSHQTNGVARVAIGDLDGQGSADLVVAPGISSSLHVLVNQGCPKFETKPLEVDTIPRRVLLADLDQDPMHRPDLVVLGQGRIQILLNRGDGTFARRDPIALIAQAVVAADLDHSGKPDLVLAYQDEAALGILLDPGASGSSPNPLRVTTQGLPTAVAAGRIDADARLDLVVVHQKEQTVEVLLNKSR